MPEHTMSLYAFVVKLFAKLQDTPTHIARRVYTYRGYNHDKALAFYTRLVDINN